MILFGSYARGTAGPDSDVDLLVVLPVIGPKRKKAIEIHVALAGVGLPKDVIIGTPEELERNRDIVGTIVYPALREGRMLYERTRRLIRAVSDWIGKAGDDLAAASRLLDPDHAGPMWVVCFHAQQCAEKYIKALLTWRGVAFPKTHDVGELLQLIPKDMELRIGSPEVAVLNPYPADARYPSDFGVVDPKEAQGVLDVALRVREECRRHLPMEAPER